MLKLSSTLLRTSRIPKLSLLFPKFPEFSTAQQPDTDSTSDITKRETFKSKNRIVTAAFASLNTQQPTDNVTEISTPHTDQKILKAKTIEELLSVSAGEGVSRRLALKIVSTLAEWTTDRKIKLGDFENDYRFIKLCRVLIKNNRHERLPSQDLSTVLSVTADDEAAKLVSTITLPQMVKVMTTLSLKKRRSTLLLRTLAYNICSNPDKLNLKQCADLLYGMSTLNFIDDNLLSRVTSDVCTEVETNKKSSVIGSILTSIGVLKYKNPILLDLLTEWMTQHRNQCRSHDVFALFITLATLNHRPKELEKLTALLSEQEAGRPSVWLDHVWSRVLLDVATPEDASSVLGDAFLERLSKSLSLSTKLKVLNVAGAVEFLIENYRGNRLNIESEFRNVVVPKRKEKLEMTESIVNSLKSLMMERYVKANIDTGYGFCIDAECVLDENCRPLELNAAKPEGNRIAIISLDYHDMCRGRVEPTGTNVFRTKLLEAKGYKVLQVPFNEFKPKDKIVNRVQYLEKGLKDLVRV